LARAGRKGRRSRQIRVETRELPPLADGRIAVAVI
jgi:hypothetical protein